eukprot:TRINITY_DN10485_c1_g1_i8.p3 TRINITY_DN10485_c1_g1~~TRINITY_DN10485_c1_g1_i8.p3  ORF type:complete len:170 (-),score=19.30 TRINITY_DN10485_c1_g1_i8:170-679(-)
MIFGNPFKNNLVYASNRNNRTMTRLPHGIHGLSNGCINDQWYKVLKGKQILKKVIDKYDVINDGIPWDAIFNELLSDQQTIEDGYELPQTGFSQEVERKFSSLFIPAFQTEKGMYGTKSQSVVAFWKNGSVEWRQRYLENGTWKSINQQFQIEKLMDNPQQDGPRGIEL